MLGIVRPLRLAHVDKQDGVDIKHIPVVHCAIGDHLQGGNITAASTSIDNVHKTLVCTSLT